MTTAAVVLYVVGYVVALWPVSRLAARLFDIGPDEPDVVFFPVLMACLVCLAWPLAVAAIIAWQASCRLWGDRGTPPRVGSHHDLHR